MEKQKLPNEQAIMILGIVSYIGCCCTSGFGGLILSGIGLFLAKKATDVYNQDPETYSLKGVNTWKIVNLVAFILSILTIIYYIYMKVTGKDIEQQEQLEELIRQFSNR